MDSVGCLTTTNGVFLRNFDENHPYSSLYIAGPWVPFFKALIACDSVYPEFGPISLYIPVTTDMLANQHGSLPESTRVLLPNLFGIRNAIASTRRAFAANAHAFQWDHNLGNGANNAGQMQPAHNVINNTVTCDARITPGRVYPVPMPQRTMDIYATSGSHIRIPPSADPLTNLPWQTYLGFAQDFSWFWQLSAQMVKHVCYFKGSTTLDSCSPRNWPTAIVVCQQQAVYLNRNAHRAAAIEQIAFNVIATSRSNVLSSPCDKLGMATPLNFQPSPNFGSINENAGPIGTTRIGPYWNFTNDRSNPR